MTVASLRTTHRPAAAVEGPPPAAAAGGVVNALGVVASVLPGGIYGVESDGRVLRCLRAASCLLRPEIGDMVLVSGPDERRLYLTAVAEQAQPGVARVEVEGDLMLASARGAVSMESATQLSLRAGHGTTLSGPQLEIDADEARCRIGRLDYSGEEARATVFSMRVIGRVYEVVVDRLVQLSKSAFRMTEGIDQVQAGQIDYRASEMTRLHGKNTVITARDLVKADAKQIHMG
ncbi:DUF3540 domain-containing protein [Variovorax sp. 160MFSha2.1]|uniref:DUF3540 domain-containing protein n=1 Tax=Variovorax sp. 160MFSha2.1 TaxID=3158367 RepID=UPI003AACE087